MNDLMIIAMELLCIKMIDAFIYLGYMSYFIISGIAEFGAVDGFGSSIRCCKN